MKNLIAGLLIATTIAALPFISNYFYPNYTSPMIDLETANTILDEKNDLLRYLENTVESKDNHIKVAIEANNDLSQTIDELTVINNKLRDNLKEQDDTIKELEKEIYLQQTIINILRQQQVKPDPAV